MVRWISPMGLISPDVLNAKSKINHILRSSIKRDEKVRIHVENTVGRLTQ